MKKSDFWFDLPQEQIAQTPIEPRDHSRLLVMDRESGKCSHHHFYDVLDYLKEGDLLVVNDSRVIPARLYERRKTPVQTLKSCFWNRRKKTFGKHW